MAQADELLTPDEAAAYLKRYVGSIRRLLRGGALPRAKVSGGWRSSEASLDAQIAGGVEPPKDAAKKRK